MFGVMRRDVPQFVTIVLSNYYLVCQRGLCLIGLFCVACV